MWTTPDTQFEYEIEAERLRQLADDLAIYSNHMVYHTKADKRDCYPESEIEFGGFLWNENILVEIFDSFDSVLSTFKFENQSIN